MSETRIIKKYPNRRLYDTELSRYITLADVRELVMQVVEFKVIDANTNEDLTRSILLQIIIEQETGGEPLFTTDILSKMIRFYGNSIQGVFSNYLDKSLNLFVEQQVRVQEQFKDMVSTNPVEAMADLTKRNLEIWQEMQDSFLKASGLDTSSDKANAEKRRSED